MQLFYDTTNNGGSNYSHAENEVGIRLQYRSIFDKFHRRMGDIQTWYVLGVKQAASQSALTTALASLEGAYNIDFGDITLKDNSAADSRHTVTNSSTFSGVQVANFSYPKGSWNMHTEYGSGSACKRTFQAILTAEVRTGSASALYAYRERVRQIGTGGPIKKYMGSLTGTPELQTVRQQTPVQYVQEGYVIGRGLQPSAPSPLSLGTEHVEKRIIEVGTAQDIRVNGKELFRTDYRYVFESLTPVFVAPTNYTVTAL